MSSERKRKRDVAETSPDDSEIVAHLKSNTDFFERHPQLLAHLRLPHDVGVNAVSLIERQVAILREKNRKLDLKLRELVAVARANDALAGRIHKFSLRLIGIGDRAEILEIIERTLREELGADEAVLLLFDEAPDSSDLFDSEFVRRLARRDPGLELFQSFLNTGRPRCGQIKGSKREFLFGRDTADIKSAALLPLGAKAATGFVAIGSHEASRFHPGMSTDFLVRLGDLIERGLAISDS
ncbi:MAG: DUF484 family protein [Gammaproteobacteria bacterium]|nr:DUF484 family protein [Gammaproteobacteria bacterium]NND60127.1 DUF484 family protein [Gammaproteobacteria bacterium]